VEPLELSQTVMDQYCARILLGTCDQPASALDLSHRFGIPIAACYRRIRRLEEMGLVYCEKALPSRNGKGLQLFRSRLKSIRISFEEGQLTASVLIEDGPLPQTAEQVLSLVESSPNA
jgi:predicted ArsR family transcriptional regulator